MKRYIDADRLKAEIERIMSRAMNEEGQDVCNYILSIIDSSQKYSLPEWEEHPEATNNIAMVWNAAATPWLDWRGHRISVRSLEKLPGFDSLPDQPVEGLEEAAENYIAPIENDEGLDYINFNGRDIKDAFIAGAKWQKGQKPEVEICPHSIKSKSCKEITGDETR